MNSALRIFFLFTALVTSSNSIFGMHTGKKPSIVQPTGTWEDQDAIDRLKNAEEWAASDQKTITITNTGNIPFTIKTDDWSYDLQSGESRKGSCSAETFLEILACNKIGHCLVKDTLGYLEEDRSYPSEQELTIAISYADRVSALFNKTFATILEEIPSCNQSKNKNTDNESDETDTTESLSPDSPVSAPKPHTGDTSLSLINNY